MRAIRNRHRGITHIDPELRVFLAESDTGGSRFKSNDPDCGEKHIIEACRRHDIAYRDRDVIYHAGAPDFTSLKMMESIKA